MLGIYFVQTKIGSAVMIAEPEEIDWVIALATWGIGIGEVKSAQLIGWAILEEHTRVVCASYEGEN